MNKNHEVKLPAEIYLKRRKQKISSTVKEMIRNKLASQEETKSLAEAKFDTLNGWSDEGNIDWNEMLEKVKK